MVSTETARKTTRHFGATFWAALISVVVTVATSPLLVMWLALHFGPVDGGLMLFYVVQGIQLLVVTVLIGWPVLIVGRRSLSLLAGTVVYLAGLLTWGAVSAAIGPSVLLYGTMMLVAPSLVLGCLLIVLLFGRRH